jgi:hypothetical protein
MKNCLIPTLAFAFFILICLPQAQAYPELCIEYKASECIRCPPGTHVYQNECYNDTLGCIEYTNGDECVKCNTTFSYLFNKKCVPLVEGKFKN